ncbi:pH-response transcription factor pacC/RIM101 [Striga asiatica]|uniref:pH-response transcription factor pacC/RIM101 n=1 Tax=Striga asiatica TaxID=4170 RepID=A0A5A7RBU1_STRAF|nr:pH-response transcription factor pacC/RIM101 [Striga asiatica]
MNRTCRSSTTGAVKLRRQHPRLPEGFVETTSTGGGGGDDTSFAVVSSTAYISSRRRSPSSSLLESTARIDIRRRTLLSRTHDVFASPCAVSHQMQAVRTSIAEQRRRAESSARQKKERFTRLCSGTGSLSGKPSTTAANLIPPPERRQNVALLHHNTVGGRSPAYEAVALAGVFVVGVEGKSRGWAEAGCSPRPLRSDSGRCGGGDGRMPAAALPNVCLCVS